MTDLTARKRRPWKRFMLATGLSICVLLLLCWKTQTKLSDVGRKLLDVDYFILGITFIISAAVHILAGAHKWYLILTGMGCDTTYGETLFVRMGSDPVRIVAPFKTGELSNIAYWWRRGKLSFARSASWIIFDKALNIIGTFFWLAVGFAAWLSQYGADSHARGVLIIGAAIAFGGALCGLLPMFSSTARRIARAVARRLHAKVERLTDQLLHAFEHVPTRRKWLLVLYGIGFQLRPLIVCGLLIAAFRADFAAMPPVAAILAWGSVVVACSNVPYTQWGTGAREWALMAVFSGFLVDSANKAPLVAVGILMAVAIHIVPAILGLPVLGSFLQALSKPFTEADANGPPEVEQ